MYLLSLLLTLSSFSGEMENYYRAESTMHGGTEDSGSSHSKTFYFAIHKSIQMNHLKMDDELLSFHKGDTLVYSVITHSGGVDYLEADKTKKLPTTFNPTSVRLYEGKYYVSVPGTQDWMDGLSYTYKKKALYPEFKKELDENNVHFAP